MKKYIVYDDYKIGYIKDIEVFIDDLDGNFLDCMKANDFDSIIYLGDSLDEAINEVKKSFESKIQTLEKRRHTCKDS